MNRPMEEACKRLDDTGFDFQIDEAALIIREGGHKRVLIQVPEGVKNHSYKLARCLSTLARASVTVFADPTWGACDIPVDEARRLGASLILHYGHTEYSMQPEPLRLEPGMKVVFLPLPSTVPLSETLVNRLAAQLDERGLSRPVLTATIQHIGELETLRERLGKLGFQPVVEHAHPGRPGQVIGCDYRAGLPSVEHDSVVIISGGRFHALGMALSTEKPVFQVDPYRMTVEDLEELRERWLRRRYAVIYKALDAKVWGIWLGTMTGQYRRALANLIESLVEKRGGEWVEFYSRTVTHKELKAVDSEEIDAHVITSCPRVPTDDFTLEEYSKPVLSPGEALMVLRGELEKYRFLW